MREKLDRVTEKALDHFFNPDGSAKPATQRDLDPNVPIDLAPVHKAPAKPLDEGFTDRIAADVFNGTKDLGYTPNG